MLLVTLLFPFVLLPFINSYIVNRSTKHRYFSYILLVIECVIYEYILINIDIKNGIAGCEGGMITLGIFLIPFVMLVPAIFVQNIANTIFIKEN